MRHLLLVSSAFLACAVAQEPTVDGETRAQAHSIANAFPT